jgi:phosphoribosyl-ATP pyrophosphohydrolase
MSELDARVLDRLYETVTSRKDKNPGSSYTAKLFFKGREKIAQKLGEEAVETVIEAIRDDKQAIAAESADLLYHLTVLWADAGLSPDEVWRTLAERQGISGLDEKASRPKD